MDDKFRGCLLGGLIGDCFGSPFEYGNKYLPMWSRFLNDKLSFDENKESLSQQISGPAELPGRPQVMRYTDDTEMVRSVAESLISKNGFDAEDMGHRFTEEYYRNHNSRSEEYGTDIPLVFQSIKHKDYTDIFQPAKKQFHGEGSLGNGGAMRTHPVPLFCYNKSQEELVDICRSTAQLTHANIDGYNGAILQSLAVRFALEADPKQELDTTAFLKKLKDVMTELEAGRPENPKFPAYCSQLDKIQEFLENNDIAPKNVANKLGSRVTAPWSVPFALYCFLRAQRPISQYETDNPFVRALYLSVAGGGDTDTIACMCCSIAGAFHGTPTVPEVLYKQCEAYKEIMDQANRMAKLVGGEQGK